MFGERITQLRKSAGISQVELARRVGVHKGERVQLGKRKHSAVHQYD